VSVRKRGKRRKKERKEREKRKKKEKRKEGGEEERKIGELQSNIFISFMVFLV
jgi:hypothetical protein